jgi:ligand-binding sensor domain-containing protein
MRKNWFRPFLAALWMTLAVLASVSALQAAGGIRATNFTYDRVVSSLSTHGDDIWAGTMFGGVLRWDTTTATFEKFTRADGLPHDHTSDIAAESTGAIWVATNLGLGHYDPDRNRWEIFNASNSPLNQNLVTAVAVDSNDVVWAGTFSTGLYRIEEDSWQNFTTSNSGLSDNFVTSIVIGLDDSVWLGAWGDGVDRFDAQNWANFDPGNTGTPASICFGDLGLPPSVLGLISFFVDVKGIDPVTGDLWARNIDDGSCLLNSVTRYNGVDWNTFTRQNSGLHSNQIEGIGADTTGDVWLGSQSGLSRFSGGAFNREASRALDAEPMGSGILLGNFEGITRFEGGVRTDFHTGTLPDGLVRDIAFSPIDPAQRWFATRGGAVRQQDREFTVFDTSNSPLPTNDVLGVEVAPNGDVWIGTRTGGAIRFDGSTWTIFNTSNSGIHSNWISNLTAAPDGTIYAGSGPLIGRVSSFDGSIWTVFPAFSVPTASDIAVAENGDVWFAGGAARRLRGGRVTTFTTADGLPGSVREVAIAPRGVIWFGTTNDGVSRFDADTETFQNFDTSDGLTSDAVRGLDVDAHGKLWVGTRSDGVNRLQGKRFRAFRFEDGLVNERIHAVEIDAFGTKWVGTDLGVSALHGGRSLPPRK